MRHHEIVKLREGRLALAAAVALAATAGAGCGGGSGNDASNVAAPRQADVQLQVEDRQGGIRMQSPQMTQFAPAALLHADDLTLVYPLPSAAQVSVRRVTSGEQEVVVGTGEATAGQIVRVDRGQGAWVGSDQIVSGPLDREAVYRLYILPPGGVRQQVDQGSSRPPTAAEIQAAREAREQREEQERRSRQERAPDDGAPESGPSP